MDRTARPAHADLPPPITAATWHSTNANEGEDEGEEEEEEEEEAVFIRGVNTNEDPPNAHQAQHLSTPPQEEEEEEEEEEVVFTRDNRGGSAQHATRATPTRSSHGPMRA